MNRPAIGLDGDVESKKLATLSLGIHDARDRDEHPVYRSKFEAKPVGNALMLLGAPGEFFQKAFTTDPENRSALGRN